MLGPDGLDVIETLEKLLTFCSDVEGLAGLSFQCHLAIIGHMAFR